MARRTNGSLWSSKHGDYEDLVSIVDNAANKGIKKENTFKQIALSTGRSYLSVRNKYYKDRKNNAINVHIPKPTEKKNYINITVKQDDEVIFQMTGAKKIVLQILEALDK